MTRIPALSVGAKNNSSHFTTTHHPSAEGVNEFTKVMGNFKSQPKKVFKNEFFTTKFTKNTKII